MSIRASNKRWLAALSAALMVCVCASASAQDYSLGDEADEIATIQTALKQLNLYSAGITGHYGEKTEAAVKKFQKKYALADNGIVNEDTRAALYEAAGITYTAGSSGASSSSSSSSASSSSSSTVSDSSILRYGTRSDAVMKLQQNLAALGLYSGTISGHYGSITEAAVMNFQRKNGLSADGIAGAKTLSKIAEAVGGSSSSSSSSGSSSSSSSSSSSGASTSASSDLLKYGVKSEAVRTLQQNLKTLGYYTGSVTGNFGRLTKEAVYNFQKANGLSADGIAGSKTLSAITSKLSGSSNSGSSSSNSNNSNSSSNNSNSSSNSSSSSSSSSTLNTSVTLQQGSSGDEVLKLQNMLTYLGFYTGNKTGNFGTLTAEAVTSYQKSKGLTADGIAGKRTLAAINADYTGSSSSSSGGSSTTPQMANNVIYDNFYNWRRNYENGEYCTVYDFSTGYSWKLRIMTKDAHMDAEPATAEDTAIMLKAFGGKTTWAPKAVWVTFSDGKTYIGSTHDVPHSPQHLSNNNFNGHLCVHFPISMDKAKSIGPYATSHQEAINEGWAATQKLKY